MVWQKDLAAVVRGVEKIAQALGKHQQQEVSRHWRNSSVRTAFKGAGVRTEERFSNVLVKQEDIVGKLNNLAATASSLLQNTKKEDQLPYDVDNLDGFSNEFRAKAAKASAEFDAELQSLAAQLKADETSAEEVDYDVEASHKVVQPPVRKEMPKSSNPRLSKIVDMSMPKKQPRLKNAKPLAKSAVSLLSESSRQRKVPGSRFGRLVNFGSLAAGLGMGALAEVTRRGLGLHGNQKGAVSSGSFFLTPANAERIVNTLCRVRGAALKLGQMISIQDNSMMNPQLQKIFERVRQSADFMPPWQMKQVISKELGTDWREKLKDFNDKPFAAASIGQVHTGTLLDGREVAMKIQYPGVAQSIDSDIDNLLGVLKVWQILPEGLYAENAMDVARRELALECNYILEADWGRTFRNSLSEDPVFYVPEVISDMTTERVLTTELVNGISLEKVEFLDQDTRNFVATNVLRLCLTELFVYGYMQTDPNWSNFLFDQDTNKISLLDFGASRKFSKKFTDEYIRVIKSATNNDKEGIKQGSIKMGFLTGYETKVMEKAHTDAVLILGEALSSVEPFDFGRQTTSSKINQLIPVMLRHRLTPPPEETYSLHRKMAGCFLLCTKLKATVDCKPIFDEVWENYKFDYSEQLDFAHETTS